MNFKLDENFGTRTLELFKAAGFDASTVRDQGLGGSADQVLFDQCVKESRCLVTLDLDFSNTTVFYPEESSGLAVIRAPRNPTRALPEQLIRQLLQALTNDSIDRRLWIIEPGRIRVHDSES